MKAEKMLRFINAILTEDFDTASYEMAQKLKAELEEEVRLECVKQSGKADVYKALSAFIKQTIKKKPNITGFHGAWIKDGKQYLTDGYSAFELNQPIEELPTVKCNDMICDVFLATQNRERNTLLPLPSLEMLKMHIKGSPVKDVTWDFGEDKPNVNAKYLETILKVLKYPIAYYNGDSKNDKILFIADNGRAILCPLYKASNK